jgi:hypothetical protein
VFISSYGPTRLPAAQPCFSQNHIELRFARQHSSNLTIQLREALVDVVFESDLCHRSIKCAFIRSLERGIVRDYFAAILSVRTMPLTQFRQWIG